MSEKVLITYASRTGTTAEVAEVIGETMRANGADVEVLPMDRVTSLAPYRAVVAGSAINQAKWLPEALAFVRTHQAELRQKPFAAFLVCVTLAIPNMNLEDQVATWLVPVRTAVPTVSEGLFAGNLDIKRIPSFFDRFMFRVSVWMRLLSEEDFRDWDKVRAWGRHLAAVL